MYIAAIPISVSVCSSKFRSNNKCYNYKQKYVLFNIKVSTEKAENNRDKYTKLM